MNITAEIESFSERIIENSERLDGYYNHHFYLFCSMNPLIIENLNCLLLGLTQASIFTTNHLLERVLKESLISYHIDEIKISNPSFDTLQQEAYKLYDDKTLNQTTILARDRGIISIEEEKIINILRNTFRNPFSHAHITKIIPSRILDIPLEGYMFGFTEGKKAISENKSVPYESVRTSCLSGAYEIQRHISRVNALDYLDTVFILMKNIDRRYLKEHKINFPSYDEMS